MRLAATRALLVSIVMYFDRYDDAKGQMKLGGGRMHGYILDGARGDTACTRSYAIIRSNSTTSRDASR